MNVPLLNLKSQYLSIKQEIDSSIKRVLESQAFVLGEAVTQLENGMAQLCQVKHAVGCASGSDALLMALMAIDLEPGQEVITSPFSFYATASSITRAGGTPRFADIDPDSYCLDPESIKKLINSNTRAIMPVHIFGQAAAMDEINEIAAQHDLVVIEDACQAIGTLYKGKPTGGLGHIACFSYYPTKNLGAYGDAGLLTTNDDSIAESIRVLRNHGEKEKYVHYEVGINSRLDSIQAAVLNAKLPHLQEWNRRRREIANFYDQGFTENGLYPDFIKIPLRMLEDQGSLHTYHQYSILCQDRDSLSAYLKEKGIGNSVFYPVALYLQPCFKYLGYNKGLCPIAERVADSVLSIPVYPEITPEQQIYVIETIKEYYK